jgi:polyisoprenoid-binding protein YceI
MLSRHLLLSLATLFIMSRFITSCGEIIKEPAIPVQQAATQVANAGNPPAPVNYSLVVKESLLYWKGRPIVGKGHEGTLQLQSGNLDADANGKLVGGQFIIDMKSIQSTDIKHEGERKSLEDHLKNENFFAVDKYPWASFLIKKITPGADSTTFTITGNLGIKSAIREISFPATLVITGDLVKAQASIIIDRTKWGINFQSRSVFTNLKDGLLADEVPISMNLVFKKVL